MTALAAPGLLALLAGVAAALWHRRLRPSVAAPVLTAVAVISALALVWSVALVAVGFVAHLDWVADRSGWCRAMFSAHATVPPPVGVAAVILLVAMLVSAVRARGRLPRALPAVGAASTELVVLPDPAPTAYAVPGRPGQIVVSAGMLRALDDDERRVLLAHERAHLRDRHHRYLRLAGLAAAAVPLVAPLRRGVHFATERWADERAAAEIGDRRLIARTIARAALLASGSPVPAFGLAGLGVPARVEALLDERERRQRGIGPLAAAFAVAALAAAGSMLQLHHLLAFVADLCASL